MVLFDLKERFPSSPLCDQPHKPSQPGDMQWVALDDDVGSPLRDICSMVTECPQSRNDPMYALAR